MARLRHRMIGARTVPFSASVIATLGTKTGLPFPARGDETSPFDGSSKSKATLGALSGVKD
jgi:hypothetical protein